MKEIEDIISKFDVDGKPYDGIIDDIKNLNDFIDVREQQHQKVITDYQTKADDLNATITQQAGTVQDLKNRLFDKMVNTPGNSQKDVQKDSTFCIDNIKDYIDFSH